MFAFPPGFDPVQFFNVFLIVSGPWIFMEVIFTVFLFFRRQIRGL